MEMAYIDHNAIEWADEYRSNALPESLKWARRQEQIAESLGKNGIHTLYCVEETRNRKSRLTKILEQRGRYTLMVDGKNVHAANSLSDCMSWGKAAGYIDKNENVTRNISKAAPAQATTRTKAVSTAANKPKLTPYKPSFTWQTSLTLAEKFK